MNLVLNESVPVIRVSDFLSSCLLASLYNTARLLIWLRASSFESSVRVGALKVRTSQGVGTCTKAKGPLEWELSRLPLTADSLAVVLSFLVTWQVTYPFPTNVLRGSAAFVFLDSFFSSELPFTGYAKQPDASANVVLLQ